MIRRIAAAVALLVSASVAAAPRIDSIAVQAAAGKGKASVVISVSIERPSLREMRCDAVLETGDGGRIPLSWSMGDSRRKTARYDYKRPGSYRIRVAGTGAQACTGLKEATVTVGAAARARAAAGPRCPSGWRLVDESVEGARYTCRAQPPARGLRCGEGTSYFSERGEIGCR